MAWVWCSEPTTSSWCTTTTCEYGNIEKVTETKECLDEYGKTANVTRTYSICGC